MVEDPDSPKWGHVSVLLCMCLCFVFFLGGGVLSRSAASHQSELTANWKRGTTALEGTKLWGVISAEVTGMVA